MLVNYSRSQNGYTSRIIEMHNILKKEFDENLFILPICYLTPLELYRWIKARIIKNKGTTLFGIEKSIIMPYPSNNILIIYITKKLLSFFLKRKKIKVDDTLIWAETYFPAFIGIILKKKTLFKVLVDIHGAQPEETIEVYVPDKIPSKVKRIYNNLSKIEKEVIKKSDYLVTVSINMINHLEKKYNTKINNYTVIPCYSQMDTFGNIQNYEKKRRTKEKLGFIGALPLLIYMGSADEWQCIKETIELWLHINKTMPSELLILTPSQERVLKILNYFITDDLLLKKVHIKTVYHNEILDYLICGDLGFLLRKPLITNIVSSPTKFSEYLASGLPVVLTKYAGSYHEVVQKEGVGFIIEDMNLIEKNSFEVVKFMENILNNRNEFANKCKTTYENYFKSTGMIKNIMHKLFQS